MPLIRKSIIWHSFYFIVKGVHIMTSIMKFDEQYDFLSNFYSCDVVYDGITYPHTESAFQAQKSLDIHIREEFARTMIKPGQAKRAGKGKTFKSLSGEELRIELRPDWEKVKNSIMYEIVRAKFEQNSDIREKLLATGDAQLIEVIIGMIIIGGSALVKDVLTLLGLTNLERH